MFHLSSVRSLAHNFSRKTSTRALSTFKKGKYDYQTYDKHQEKDYKGKRFNFSQSNSFPSNTYRGNKGDPFSNLKFSNTIRVDTDKVFPISESNLNSITQKVLTEKNFENLTPVQGFAYDPVFNRKDVVARSRTGTGKTFAFGIPIIERIVSEKIRSHGKPLILVLEPTRELANQVSTELQSIASPHRMRVTSIFGGVSSYHQIKSLQQGVEIIVATPGRLLDLHESGSIDLSQIKSVVLDEGDTMLEMGFQKDVENILELVNTATRMNGSEKPQTLLFSATMPNWICSITEKIMNEPIFLDAVRDGETRLADTISHLHLHIDAHGEVSDAVGPHLENLILKYGNNGQCIIFGNTKNEVHDLAHNSYFKRLKVAPLHGDITQVFRQETIKSFKNKSIDVLIATDVAARGLDISGVDLVIHLGPPNDPDSFVHRSGRTGRAGRDGNNIVCTTTSMQRRKVYDFEKILNFETKKISVPTISDVINYRTNYVLQSVSKVPHTQYSRFIPYASAILAKIKSGDISFDQPDFAGSENHTDVELQLTDLVSRVLSVAANVNIENKSKISGETGLITLKFVPKYDMKLTPTAFAWVKHVKNILSKKFEEESEDEEDLSVSFGSSQLIYIPSKNTNALLVDLDEKIATKLLTKNSSYLNEFTLSEANDNDLQVSSRRNSDRNYNNRRF